MKCNEIHELMPDLATGSTGVSPEVSEHLQACADCAGTLAEFRKTMLLLDEWEAPEPSPYFDTRFQARLREEKAKQPSGWFAWLRRPALAASLAVLAVVGVTVFENGGGKPPANQAAVVTVPGTAVGDLQALDKNHDLYSDFDVLDDLQVQSDVTANP
jgi:anti-sigma factor RsiW